MNKNQEKLSENRYMVLRLSLSLECYEDETNNRIPEIRDIYKDINNYREIKAHLTLEEELKMTNDIIDKFYKILEIIGTKNFDIYDDGYVEYIGERDDLLFCI